MAATDAAVARINAVSVTILDHYLGVTGQDRVQTMRSATQAAAGHTAQAPAAVWQQVATAQKTSPKSRTTQLTWAATTMLGLVT